jgi:hypothetical protein
MAIQMVMAVDPSARGCTLSTRVSLSSSFPLAKHRVDIYFMIAITISSFVEMIRFFTTLILNVDESELL